MIEALKDERVQLARWLVKTAIMFSLASLKGDLPIDFPEETTRKLREGILPDCCWADLAYSREATVGGTISRCFRVINGGKYEPSQILAQGLGFQFTVQFNHLLLRVARTPEAKVTYRSRQGEVPIRLFPTARGIPSLFTYENIMHFDEAPVLETWPGCPGEIA
jgi:hypothetical protein